MLGKAASIAGLVIQPGGTLEIVDGGTLTLANGIDNFGTLELNSSGADPTFSVSGTIYLYDGGLIALVGPTADNLIAAAGPGAALVNVDNTIAGSGMIGQGDGALTLINGIAGTIEAIPLVTGDSGLLILHTGNIITNSGLMGAGSGGTLQIDDNVTNTGTIEALAGGVVSFQDIVITNVGGTIESLGADALVELTDSTIIGGTLSTSGTGSFDSNIDIVVSASGPDDPNISVFDGSTSGPLTVEGYVGVFQGAQLELKGTIHIDGANGEIDIGGPNGSSTTPPTHLSNLVIDGVVTIDTDGISGDAQISLDSNATYTAQIIAATGGGTLDNVNTLIAGSGQIGAGNPLLLLINETAGVIDADGALPLTIDNDSPTGNNTSPSNSVVNSGTIEATGGGTLIIENTTIDNSTFNPSTMTGVDGHVEAAGGSYIDLDGATILQGFVTVDGGGTIETVSGTSNEIETANGPTHNTGIGTITIDANGTVLINDDSSLVLASPYDIENSGKIELEFEHASVSSLSQSAISGSFRRRQHRHGRRPRLARHNRRAAGARIHHQPRQSEQHHLRRRRDRAKRRPPAIAK